MTSEFEVAAMILLLLAASLEGGFRIGRRSAKRGELAGGGHLGAIQGATLGLLALLLGFSFAAAASRFMERQDLIVQEANAIGTAWLRADMLAEPHKSELKNSLAQYVERRLLVSESLRHGLKDDARSEISRMHERIWKAASEGVAAKPAVMVVVLPPVNDVIDLHATRLSAGRKHLPALIMGLLMACSALSMATIGFGCGLARQRSMLMTGSLALTIGIALWITVDLDHPRAGHIRLSDAPLMELNLEAQSTAPAPGN